MTLTVDDRELIEPSAYLKHWTDNDGSYRCRVDLTEICEPWMDALNPTITPLYAADRLQSLLSDRDKLEGENKRLENRLRELSLDVLAWWKTVFGVDYVHTLPGETPGELAARAAERIAALTQTEVP